MSVDGPEQRLIVLLLTDVVGSTALKSRLGMPAYAALLKRHNALFESAVGGFRGARVIKHTGDGYLAAFDTPSDAARFALTFQRSMHDEPWGDVRLQTRVGIHSGQVEIIRQAGQDDVVGLTADLAARLMSLGLGGQILLTRGAFDDARQFVPDDKAAAPIRWLAHGTYQAGGDEPIDVFEVGYEGINPLAPPPDTAKSRRLVRHDEESVLGWRPSVGDAIPGKSRYVLVQKLGEGGFGEVWLAEDRTIRDRRVFKFCFNVERLRSLKREYVLFRLIREALGERDDIVRLLDYNLDAPPFYLESEYSAGGNLLEWAQHQGGAAAVPQAKRVRIVADVCDAVAAAHSVGILHKDIKPSNILMVAGPDGRPRPQLADFGIGFIADRSGLAKHAITETGFTQVTEAAEGGSSRTGTRMYAPPESIVNRPFTTHGDVYALGVLLYQMACGDLERPLTPEWRDDVADLVLRDDIAAAVSRDAASRVSAAGLGKRLRELDARRDERAAAEQAAAAAARRAKRRRSLAVAGGALAVAMVFAGVGVTKYVLDLGVAQRQTLAALDDAKRQRDLAEAREREAVAARELASQSRQFLINLLAAAKPVKGPTTRPATVQAALTAGAAKLDATAIADPLTRVALHRVMAEAFEAIGEFGPMLRQFELARAELAKLPSADPELRADLLKLGATATYRTGNAEEADRLNREAMELYRRTLGESHPKTQVAAGDAAANAVLPNKRLRPEWAIAAAFFFKATPADVYDRFDRIRDDCVRARARGDLAAAKAVIREFADPFRDSAVYRDHVPSGTTNVGFMQHLLDDPVFADTMLLVAIDYADELFTADSIERSQARAAYGEFLVARRRFDEAERVIADAWDRLPEKSSNETVLDAGLWLLKRYAASGRADALAALLAKWTTRATGGAWAAWGHAMEADLASLRGDAVAARRAADVAVASAPKGDGELLSALLESQVAQARRLGDSAWQREAEARLAATGDATTRRPASSPSK
jgi:serine/threonine-protein kinase